MTICRHTLYLGITGYMTGTRALTQSRIFTAWAVFLSTLLGSFSFTSGIYAPGFQDTPLLEDCTENWIASPETSAMQHSVHKKTMTLVMCTDTYAGSISDNDLTADCGVLDMIQDKGATVLTDFELKTCVMPKAFHIIVRQ